MNHAYPPPGPGYPPRGHLGPTGPRRLCRCGVTADRLVRGQGFWHAVGWGGFLPLLGLVIHVVSIGIAAGLAEPPAIRIVAAAVPVLSLTVSLAVQRGAGHRGWCWLGRSGYFALIGPAVILGSIR